ncbi:AfsR/SARP family transcriptional regulator [Amycolatopsis sp. VC5-11]|uniref:AfsR/SARP family transcriptional regulator n=1 Tax=Amycolatopsis sp. VC5-11 TaxID=3120156 RepID=UPI00300BC346
MEILHHGTRVTPSPAKVRKVLAMLLMHANRKLSMDAMVYEMWGETPPRSAVVTLQTYVYQLRKVIALSTGIDQAKKLLETTQPGYVLHVSPDRLDSCVFDRLVAEAHRLAAANELDRAARTTEEALSLWNGAPLSNVHCGTMLESYSTHLEDKRISALELRITINSRRGRYREMIAELRSLAAAHPFNEWFHAQLIEALNKAGRRKEALEAYRSVRSLLNDELGLDPLAELREAHDKILTTD